MIDIEEVLNDLDYVYRHDMPYDVYCDLHDTICLLGEELDKLRIENKKLKRDLNAEHALVIALTYSDGGLRREIERAALASGNESLCLEMLDGMKHGELLAEAKQLAKMLVFLCEQNEEKAKLMQEIWSHVVAEHPNGDFPDMGAFELRMRGLGVEVEE